MVKPAKFKQKYWEREEPKVVPLGNNILKLFIQAGKIQVYPKVDTAPNGVGRGSTIDIENMTIKEMENLIKVIQYAITEFTKIKSQKSL